MPNAEGSNLRALHGVRLAAKISTVKGAEAKHTNAYDEVVTFGDSSGDDFVSPAKFVKRRRVKRKSSLKKKRKREKRLMDIEKKAR